MWTEISGDDVKDIQGGPYHTLVLYQNGDLHGSGKNDNGQLGELDELAEPMGTFVKLKHISKVDTICSGSDFTYAK